MSLTQAEVKAKLTYDPDTGEFRRNKPYGNRPLGGVDDLGYFRISINGKRYRGHRLAVLYMTGEWPPDDVDHINRNRADNRWCNLRIVSRSANLHNAGKRRDNSSGVPGVCYLNRERRWWACLQVNKQRKSLGYFKSFNDAVFAVVAAKAQLLPNPPPTQR